MAIALDADLGTATNTDTLTTAAAAASGSRVFVFVGWSHATATLTGATGGGLTYVVDHQFEDTVGADTHVGIISADAPSGLASSTNIQASFSTSVGFRGLAAVSFTGIATGASGYVDATSTGLADFNQDWATNNVVTTNADDLLLAISCAPSGTSNTADTNYTEIHDWNFEGANDTATVYRIVSSTGTYNPGGNWSTGVSFQVNIGIAYKASAAAPAAQAVLVQAQLAPPPFVSGPQAFFMGEQVVIPEPPARVTRSPVVYR